MNDKQINKLIQLLQAVKEGKEIERRYYNDTPWTTSTINNLVYDVATFHDTWWKYYRIKPEKYEYLNIYNDGYRQIFPSRVVADKGELSGRIACIKVEIEEGRYDE